MIPYSLLLILLLPLQSLSNRYNNYEVNYAVYSDNHRVLNLSRTIHDPIPKNLFSQHIVVSGNLCRFDFNSPNFTQTSISSDTETTVYRQFNNNKYKSILLAHQYNKYYPTNLHDSIYLYPVTDTLSILNLLCYEAEVTCTNGDHYKLYYTPLLAPPLSNPEYNQHFKGLKGFVLYYEILKNKQHDLIVYMPTSLTIHDISDASFIVDETNYSELTW